MSAPVYRNIKFWLIVLFLLRLIGITNPPIEKSHNWRQATGLMVARSFYEVEPNILHPRKEDTDGTTGIIGFEFPLLNYTHFIVAKLFGYTHWYSRLINLIISTFGLYFFYLLIRKVLSEPIAFYSTLILATSVWFAYSRKSMSDVFSVSLVIMGAYYGVRYLDEGKRNLLVLFGVIACLGMLSKIPAVTALGFLLLPMLEHGFFKRRSLHIMITTAVAGAVVYWWYFIWNIHLSETYGSFYNKGFSMSEGLDAIRHEMLTVLDLVSHTALMSYLFFAASVAGMIMALRKGNRMVWVSVVAVMIGFVLYALKSGEIFLIHHYYLVPLAPAMAIFAGYFISKVNRPKLITVILVLGMVEAVANQQHDLFNPKDQQYKMTLEGIMDEYVPTDALVAVNTTDGNHQLMYLSHRKGWMIMNSELRNEEVLADHRTKGCKYLVIDKHIQKDKLLYPLLYEDEHFAVYRL